MAPTTLRKRPCPYCGNDNIVTIFRSVDTCEFCGGEYQVMQGNKLWAIPLLISVTIFPLSIIFDLDLEIPQGIVVILVLLCGYMLERGVILTKIFKKDQITIE